jgi:hypothetical protein
MHEITPELFADVLTVVMDWPPECGLGHMPFSAQQDMLRAILSGATVAIINYPDGHNVGMVLASPKPNGIKN